MTTPILADPTAFKTYYLGAPGSMQAIRTPNAAVTQPLSRSENVHQLISGGVAVTRRGRGRRGWQLGWAGCTPDTADQMIGFYLGVFGDGPFCYVDPSWRNMLPTDVSTFGAQLDAVSVWSRSLTGSAPLSFDTTVTAPSPQSGIARWANAANGEQVGLGAWNGTRFVPSTAIGMAPVLTPTTTSLTVYARAVTGTPSLSLRAQSTDSTFGTVTTQGTTTATLSSSAWTRLAVQVPAGVTASYWTPNLLCNTASALILLSAAQLQYGRATPDPWVIGLGVPWVVPASEMASDYDLLYARNHGLALIEI